MSRAVATYQERCALTDSTSTTVKHLPLYVLPTRIVLSSTPGKVQ